MSHSNSTFSDHKFTILNAFTKFYKIEKNEIMLNTFMRSLIIWEPASIETWAQEINRGGGWNELWGLESWTVPQPLKLYFNPCYQDTQNLLYSTVLDADSILGLTANMCRKPVVAKGLVWCQIFRTNERQSRKKRL